jgi:uncharacterized membrane protein YhaH (DUF805 family)
MIKSLFSLRGRLNRIQFFLRTLAFYAALLVYIVICLVLITNGQSGIGIIIALSLVIPFLLLNLSMKVRRLHDMNRSALWLLAYIPFEIFGRAIEGAAVERTSVLIVAIIIGLTPDPVLLFGKGTEGANRYGELAAMTEPITRTSIEETGSKTTRQMRERFMVPPVLA